MPLPKQPLMPRHDAPENDVTDVVEQPSQQVLASTPRALLTRPTGSVIARHVRWGTEHDGETRTRIAQGARPAGLFFSTLDWSGHGDGPTDHQRAQSVESVFSSFNWT
jgi:hypothetical protein